MVPFHEVCSRLAKEELRTITIQGCEFLPEDEYGLFECYCEERDCDCRRVMLTVVSRRRNKEEANISFGFDPDDELRGPFLDPINTQGKFADEILAVVSELLEHDTMYVARLEHHYRLTKEITSGRLRPQDAKPFTRLSKMMPLASIVRDSTSRQSPRPIAAPRSNRGDVDAALGKSEIFERFCEIGESAGFDMTSREDFDEFLEVCMRDAENNESEWQQPITVITPDTNDDAASMSGTRDSVDRQSLRDAKKRQRNAKKRNRR